MTSSSAEQSVLARPTVASSVQAPTPAASESFRWFDLQSATLATRGRWAEPEPTGTVHQAEMQHRERFEGFFKADKKAKYTLHATVSSGFYFSRAFAETGWGKLWYNEIGPNMYVRQLYGVAKPIEGIELSAGSMPLVRGAVSEAISYDEDGWITGERISIKRPKQIFFDEVSVTNAYLGDFYKANFFARTDRMERSNYRQVLFAKKAGKRVYSSVDYTFSPGLGHTQHYVRFGTVIDTKGYFLDHFRAAAYVRPTPGRGAGFEVMGDRHFGTRGFVQSGFVFVDQDYGNMISAAESANNPKASNTQGYAPGGNLNADRFTRGHAPFLLVRYNLAKDLELEMFAKKDLYQNAFQVKNANVAYIELVYNLRPTANHLFSKAR
jgi:hypothetical protein